MCQTAELMRTGGWERERRVWGRVGSSIHLHSFYLIAVHLSLLTVILANCILLLLLWLLLLSQLLLRLRLLLMWRNTQLNFSLVSFLFVICLEHMYLIVWFPPRLWPPATTALSWYWLNEVSVEVNIHLWRWMQSFS